MGNSPQDRNTGELITWNCGGSFEFLLQEVCLPVLSVSDLSTDCEPEGLCCCGRGVRHVPFSSTVSMAEDSKYSGLQIGARFIFFFFSSETCFCFFLRLWNSSDNWVFFPWSYKTSLIILEDHNTYLGQRMPQFCVMKIWCFGPEALFMLMLMKFQLLFREIWGVFLHIDLRSILLST